MVKWSRDSRLFNKFIEKKSLPIFKGSRKDDIDSWFYALEESFEFLDLDDKEKLYIARSQLREGALNTFRQIKSNSPNMSWTDLKVALMDCFQPQDLQTKLRKDLTKLRQGKSLKEYIDKFSNIMNQIRNMGRG